MDIDIDLMSLPNYMFFLRYVLKKSMLHIQMYTCFKLVQFSWYCIYVCLNNHSYLKGLHRL